MSIPTSAIQADLRKKLDLAITSAHSNALFNFNSGGDKSAKVSGVRDDTNILSKKDMKGRKPPRKRESTVVSTTRLKKFKADGNKMINQYKVESVLGQGSFATVILASDSETG
jgi:serine/threonine protein kinase